MPSAIFFRAINWNFLDSFRKVDFRPQFFHWSLECPKKPKSLQKYQFFWVKLWLCQLLECLMSVDYCSSLKNLSNTILNFSVAYPREKIFNKWIYHFSHYLQIYKKKTFLLEPKFNFMYVNKSCFCRNIQVFNILIMFLGTQGVPIIIK